MSAEPVTVLCPECGTIISVKDVQTLLLTLHQINDCDVSTIVAHKVEGGA